MTTYALVLSYRGTDYAGWQRQPNAVTVQEVVETALAEVLGEPVRVVGSGRTDAGVHARGQVAHLRLGRDFPESALTHATNKVLPEAVRVLSTHRMIEEFHAQRDALAKEYRYRLRSEPVLSPIDSPFCVRLASSVDIEALERCADRLVGRHDWSAFAKSGGSHDDPWRRVDTAAWHSCGPEIQFRIRGEGFLRGMVRALVGTMLEVGRGRRSLASFESLVGGSERSSAGPNAPARGLVLHRVDYAPSSFADPVPGSSERE